MKSETKTWLIVLVSVAGVFIVPAILVLLHEYLNAIIFIITFILCITIFSYGSYTILLPTIQRADLEEQEIKDRFHGDPEKMRFYRGFKKYFAGELNEEELKRWFINHPRH